MATFLTVPRLRALEVPVLPRALFDLPEPRPVLVAQWHVDCDGQLVCRWLNVAGSSASPPD
jgi:hypothetical protein